ncbi:MAG: ABC transporter ATP-binding protein, partial [Salana multivorans]|nr:ABC transporter ATP-binding protein [Salana multivorans]
EVASLIERVVLLDGGRVLLDEPTDDLRGRAATIVGDADAVERFVAGREVIGRERLGHVLAATVYGALSADDRVRLRELGLDVSPVSLQQLVVRTTRTAEEGALR